MVDQHVGAPQGAVDQHADAPVADRPVTQTGVAPTEVPRSAAPANEGRTVAAWTTVAIIVLGAVVVALGITAGWPWLAWTGGGVIVVGLIVGAVLRAAGYGQRTRGGVSVR